MSSLETAESAAGEAVKACEVGATVPVVCLRGIGFLFCRGEEGARAAEVLRGGILERDSYACACRDILIGDFTRCHVGM